MLAPLNQGVGVMQEKLTFAPPPVEHSMDGSAKTRSCVFSVLRSKACRYENGPLSVALLAQRVSARPVLLTKCSSAAAATVHTDSHLR